MRVYLDRDVAVAALGRLPDGPENVAGRTDVAHREVEENALGVAAGMGGKLCVVRVALRERVFEDRRVGSDTDHSVFLDRARKRTGEDQVTRQVVDPDALTEFSEPMKTRSHSELEPPAMSLRGAQVGVLIRLPSQLLLTA